MHDMQRSNFCGFTRSERNREKTGKTGIALNLLIFVCEKAKHFYVIQFCKGV